MESPAEWQESAYIIILVQLKFLCFDVNLIRLFFDPGRIYYIMSPVRPTVSYRSYNNTIGIVLNLMIVVEAYQLPVSN